MRVQFLGLEDPLEEDMATYSTPCLFLRIHKIIILSFKEEENKLMEVENKRDRKGNQKGEKLESS